MAATQENLPPLKWCGEAPGVGQGEEVVSHQQGGSSKDVKIPPLGQGCRVGHSPHVPNCEQTGSPVWQKHWTSNPDSKGIRNCAWVKMIYASVHSGSDWGQDQHKRRPRLSPLMNWSNICALIHHTHTIKKQFNTPVKEAGAIKTFTAFTIFHFHSLVIR